jgi:hypothetical protein
MPTFLDRYEPTQFNPRELDNVRVWLEEEIESIARCARSDMQTLGTIAPDSMPQRRRVSDIANAEAAANLRLVQVLQESLERGLRGSNES